MNDAGYYFTGPINRVDSSALKCNLSLNDCPACTCAFTTHTRVGQQKHRRVVELLALLSLKTLWFAVTNHCYETCVIVPVLITTKREVLDHSVVWFRRIVFVGVI